MKASQGKARDEDEWADIMKDEKNKEIAVSMLKEAKKVGGQLQNRDILIAV